VRLAARLDNSLWRWLDRCQLKEPPPLTWHGEKELAWRREVETNSQFKLKLIFYVESNTRILACAILSVVKQWLAVVKVNRCMIC